jgi:hypothetical protein
MVDEKDRFGEKLRQKEKAEEDRFFAERDRALLDRLRHQPGTTPASCPRCGEPLVPREHANVTVEECPGGHGVWLDRSDIETIARREHDSWLGRLLPRGGG